MSDRKERPMSRILVTGSTDGLGLAAARTLMADGHEVVLHARSKERASAVSALSSRSAGVVIGDLSSGAETRSVADQVNRIGRMDAVIHNAGIYLERSRGNTPEGHARTLAVNTLAPYILTALIERPDRLVYLSSGMHQSGSGSPQRSPVTGPRSSATRSIPAGCRRRWAEPERRTTWKRDT
jgi:NAD(P)-dependent dehydrogenase (short-subunit alcohol dehydrogenase family)